MVRVPRLKIVFLALFLFPILLISKTRNSGSMRSVVSFVWQNPSECKIDTLFQILLLEDKSKFRVLSDFWKRSSLCKPMPSGQYAESYYLIKKSLVKELKRVFALAHKQRPKELERALHTKSFQRFVLEELQSAYVLYSQLRIKSFVGIVNTKKIIEYVEDNYSSKFKEGDIRRLVEFSVHRSANEISVYGNQWVEGAYSSVVRVGNSVGVVSRLSWGFEGDPKYEPDHSSEDIDGRFEVGITSLGNDKVGAALVGVFEVGNQDKPNQLLALNVSWRPFESEDMELSLYASIDKNYNEKFVALSTGYSYESHPFEPLTNFIKKRKLEKELKRKGTK